MKKKTLNTKQGFTIIEVVLVLAIAGLIFLMVFVAFPALQRNQRDTQRRQDYANLSAAVITFATNSNGHFPTNSAEQDLLKSVGEDPGGKAYDIVTIGELTTQADGSVAEGQIKIYSKATCGSGNAATKGGDGVTEKQFVILGYLEGGTYCLEGHL